MKHMTRLLSRLANDETIENLISALILSY